MRGPLTAVLIRSVKLGGEGEGGETGAYSAICQVPPCGTNLGAELRSSKSSM
jgi:hypothetical protein